MRNILKYFKRLVSRKDEDAGPIWYIVGHITGEGGRCISCEFNMSDMGKYVPGDYSCPVVLKVVPAQDGRWLQNANGRN